MPAHLIALACVAGLAFANVLRLHAPFWAGAVAVAASLVVPRPVWRVALVVAVAAWWWGSVRLDELDRSVLAAQVGTAGRGVAVTTAEARAGLYDQKQFARLERYDGRTLDERVELELPLGRSPPQGAVLSLLAVVRAPRGPSNGFDEATWLRRQGVHVVLQVDAWRVVGRRGGLGGLADRLRAWLRRASSPGLTGERRALVEGVLLGDENGLSDNLKQAFRRSGLYHLLAVSGQNVVLLAGGVLVAAAAFGARRSVGHLAALGAIAAYVLAVGPQPSVIRAAVSGAAVSVAWLLGRLKDAWQVLLLAAVVLLAWNPYTVYDAGFQLSFVAVLAIFLLGGPFTRALEGYPLPGRFRPIIGVSAACTLATAPLLWLQFGQVPLLGVVANALVELAVGPLLGLAFVAAVVDPVSPALASLLAYANGWVAAYIVACARAVAAVPGAQVSGRAAALAATAASLLALVAFRRARTATG
ncbi:MAG TPA: ComEC/Rec2 family competence protein [Gaiellaceae bacterium]|nr:ComEC/Rec2 family competence protein [Gaiellaceae bacterium]